MFGNLDLGLAVKKIQGHEGLQIERLGSQSSASGSHEFGIVGFTDLEPWGLH